MKKTKDIIKFLSKEDAEEFKQVATGRKFCKKGERLVDICDEEIARYEYKHSHNIFAKIFRGRKFRKNKEKLMLENRVSSTIRALVANYVDNQEEPIERNELIQKVKTDILESVSEYEKAS